MWQRIVQLKKTSVQSPASRIKLTALVFLAATQLVAVRAARADGALGDPDVPTILLVQGSSSPNTPQQQDLALRLKITLRDALTKTGRFQVHTFLAGESIIKRALNEHLIAADDLAEPHKPEGLQRIAHAIGARFILKLRTTLDKTEALTEMSYMDNPNRSDWLVLADERVNIPLIVGKKRLKADDVVNLTVDAITARVGTPTHLAGNLKVVVGSRTLGGPDKSAAKAKPGRIAKNDPKQPDPTAPDPKTPDAGTATAGPPSGGHDTAVAGPGTGRVATKPDKQPRKAGSPALKGAQPPVDPPHTEQTKPTFTNQADPSHDTLPAQPAVAPPPVVARPDYEAQAVRYRQTGDLSNAVLSLRKAVNDRPRDVGLRRQLIQAYQAKQMPEAAHSEALRALRLDAANPGLFRLYGEVLLAEGDTTGALQAFRDGIKADPNDILCQVALGDALLKDNHYLLALEAYSAASKSDGKSPLPHRRIARALAAKAGTDPDQYQASLAEVRRAQELTPPSDTISYSEDYIAIMKLVEGRIRSMLDELQGSYQARVQAKKTDVELQRFIADMKQRCIALGDYLDKLPAAAGQDVTQAHYAQADALLLQAVGFFKDLVEKGDDRFADSLKSQELLAQRELTAASQRLSGTKSPDKSRDT